MAGRPIQRFRSEWLAPDRQVPVFGTALPASCPIHPDQGLGASAMQTVLGALRLAGITADRLILRRSVDGERAYLTAQGEISASNVDVDDINAAGGNPLGLRGSSLLGMNSFGMYLIAERVARS